jgi:hypothetical protein
MRILSSAEWCLSAARRMSLILDHLFGRQLCDRISVSMALIRDSWAGLLATEE